MRSRPPGRLAQRRARAVRGRRGQRPVLGAGRGAREQRPAAGDVLREPARREHDAAGRGDPHRAVRCGGDDARHAAVVVAQQLGDRRADPDVHAEVERRTQQPADERGSVDQLHPATAGQQVVDVPAEPPGGVQQPAGVAARHREERHEVRPGHDPHAEERGLVELAPQLHEDVVAERAAVDRGGCDGAVAGAGAGQPAVDVADLRAGHERQRGLLVEEPHHLRRRGEEGVDAGGVVVGPECGAQVGAELLDVLVHAVGVGERVARRPHPAAGPRRGAAAHVGPLQYDDPQAVVGGGDGGREAAGAGADHDDVGG